MVRLKPDQPDWWRRSCVNVVSVVQLVSRQEIDLKKFCTELRSVVGLHQILAGNVITFLEALL